MNIQETIREFLNKHLITFGPEVEYSNDDNIFEKGFVNSLFAMKLLRYIERKFDMEVLPEEMNLENFSSITNITHLIQSKCTEKSDD